MEFINDIFNALEKRKSKLRFSICKNEVFDLNIPNLTKLILPDSVKEFYTKIASINIVEPRKFEILSPNHFEIIEDKYILFSFINDEKVCFDTSNINSADEWDIICISNHYIITKTLSSYLTNKIWAWVDRGRQVWKDEFAS